MCFNGMYWIDCSFNSQIHDWAQARITIFGVRPDDVKQILTPANDHKSYQTYGMDTADWSVIS